jgi:hypothetical protein
MAVYLWPGNDGAGNSCRCAGGYFRRHGVNYHSGSNIAEDRVALSAEGNPRSGIRGALGSNLSFAWVINTEFEKKLRSAIQVAWHGAVRLW